MASDSFPSALPVERFLAALAQVHPTNVAALVRSAAADARWSQARRTVAQRPLTDGAPREAIDAITSRVREIVAAAASADTGDGERPSVEETESVLLAAAHALIARGALERSGDDATFPAVYRPFEAMIPLNTLIAGGDEERERLVGGDGTL